MKLPIARSARAPAPRASSSEPLFDSRLRAVLPPTTLVTTATGVDLLVDAGVVLFSLELLLIAVEGGVTGRLLLRDSDGAGDELSGAVEDDGAGEELSGELELEDGAGDELSGALDDGAGEELSGAVVDGAGEVVTVSQGTNVAVSLKKIDPLLTTSRTLTSTLP